MFQKKTQMERFLDGVGNLRGRAQVVPKGAGDFAGHLVEQARIGVNGFSGAKITKLELPSVYTEADKKAEFAQMYADVVAEHADTIVKGLTRRFNRKGTTLRDGSGEWIRLSQLDGYDEVSKIADRANARARYWKDRDSERVNRERSLAQKVRQDFKISIVQQSKQDVRQFRTLVNEDALSAAEFVSNKGPKTSVISTIRSDFIDRWHARLDDQQKPLVTVEEIAAHAAVFAKKGLEPFKAPKVEEIKPIEFNPVTSPSTQTQEAAQALRESIAALKVSLDGIYHSEPEPIIQLKRESFWSRAVSKIKDSLPKIGEITPQGRLRRVAIATGVVGVGVVALNIGEAAYKSITEHAEAAPQLGDKEKDTEFKKIDIKVGPNGTPYFDLKGAEELVKTPPGVTREQIRAEEAIRTDRLKKTLTLLNHFAQKHGHKASEFKPNSQIDSSQIITEVERKLLVDINKLPLSQQQEFDVLFRRGYDS
jgi:hypothetical protein